ncbi:putative transposon, En/Spm-like protein [Tanacetum coccineum]|uniref:Transposon, En/Spm-like protein n=1 Tax=Tanacetum coccineum TaxID=301880 RepID=A0ABQ5F255_9ASTR
MVFDGVVEGSVTALERAATTASSLEAEQGTGSGSGPRHQDTIGDTIARTKFENVSKTSYDSPLEGVNTPRSDEDSIQLKELMEMCTNLYMEFKTLNITNMFGDQEDASKLGRNIDEIDADVDILLVHEDARIQGRKAQGTRDEGKAKMVEEDRKQKEPTKEEKIRFKLMRNLSKRTLVNTFVPMDTEKVEGSKAKAAGSKTRVEESSKRAGEELDRESIKKQNVEDETKQAELKECCEIIPFDEDAIYYHITRADGITQVYMRFKDMLKMFDREDLEVLYRIVKDREQGRYLIKSWKLIDSCGVHCLMLESMYIYMLVEKEYPLAQFTYRRMWEGKLQVDYECEMAFELLRNRPEGCIAEETITEETIEFFSEYHKSMETIGIPPDKHETYENEEGKPLSAGKSSEVSVELFQKAHLYVIQNTDELVPYIERHKQVLKTENPGKRIAFLENEHNKSFAKWLREERELAIDKESVSETIRWISYGPRATVVKYDAYNINGYTFRTKCHDGKVYRNSGVSVEAIDLNISKEVATTKQAYYYGVLQEIWVPDYRFRQIPLFKCDWVNHKSGGVKRDKLGYTLVDLNNLSHKVDPFVLGSRALQVFYVKNLVDKKLSIVFKTPPKNYKDTYGEVDEEFSTVIHHRNDNVLPLVDQRDLANESRDDYYRKDCGENIVVNLDSSSDNNNSDSYSTSQISTSEEIDYDSPEPPKSLLKWYHYLSDEYKDNGRFWGSKSGCNESDVKPSWKDIKKAKACMLAKAQASEASSKAKVEACGSKAKLQASTKTLIVKSPGRGSLEVDKIIDISSDSSDDRRWAAKKASAPVFYGPSTQGLLDAYGYGTIEEYLEWNYFPSTDNESTNMETTDKGNTDKDCIDDSNSAMSKGKYVPVCKKNNPNVYSHVPVTGCVLGLASVTTWDEIEKKMGARKTKTCADKAKGKRKVSCGS